MRRLFPILILMAAAFSACAPAGTALYVPAPTMTPAAPLASPTAPPTGTPTPAPSATLTPTLVPTITPTFGPTPTDTLLPLLMLPTLEATEPAFNVWDGVPTYIADSQPGFYFRVKYDPRVWAQVQDSYGQPALGHRTIDRCILSPALSRGLPPDVQVEHDIRKIGNLNFEINIAMQNGVWQFITYQATDRVIFTSFELDFVDQIDECMAAAETVLGTLTSVPEAQATPVQ